MKSLVESLQINENGNFDGLGDQLAELFAWDSLGDRQSKMVVDFFADKGPIYKLLDQLIQNDSHPGMTNTKKVLISRMNKTLKQLQQFFKYKYDHKK